MYPYSRNMKYYQAIRAAVSAFHHKNGRPPIVLDVGTYVAIMRP